MVSIEYLPGRDNSAADTLSRQDWGEEEEGETESRGPLSGGGGCGGAALPIEENMKME